MEKGKKVKIRYTNWKSETTYRTIIPEEIWFGSTQFHPEEQWLMTAFDVDKQAPRTFAMKDMKEWEVVV